MRQILIVVLLVMGGLTVNAQQPINPKNMNYLMNPKVNNLIYHDSVFRGSKEFKHLFYRTGDALLLEQYNKHQSNKIVGQVSSMIGALALIVGINQLGDNKGLGWGLIGGGFLTSMAGGYFTLAAQRNLLNAVNLFNSRYNNTAISIGVGDKQAGIVYKF